MARAIGAGVPKSQRIWIPGPVFLIEHSGAGAVLIDTGVHPRAPADPRATMGPTASLMYEFRTGPDGDLLAQLHDRGVSPQDVSTVVMTHLHTDHASAICEFPAATFVVDRREWDAANARGAVMNGYERKHFAHPFDWRTVEFAQHVPVSGFDASFDLFGDGTVTLLRTPGHTPGHMSVLVRAGAHEVLLTADAAYTQRTINDGTLPGIARNYDQFRASLARIQAFAAERPDAVVIVGHDREQWPTLDAVYE